MSPLKIGCLSGWGGGGVGLGGLRRNNRLRLATTNSSDTDGKLHVAEWFGDKQELVSLIYTSTPETIFKLYS